MQIYVFSSFYCKMLPFEPISQRSKKAGIKTFHKEKEQRKTQSASFDAQRF
jgi:hypothetical protein